jgi:SPP1 gp7 family putative phage head morphogenesis protein
VTTSPTSAKSALLALDGILARFEEQANAAAGRASPKLLKIERTVRKLMTKRFQAQAKFMLDEVLPRGKGHVFLENADHEGGAGVLRRGSSVAGRLSFPSPRQLHEADPPPPIHYAESRPLQEAEPPSLAAKLETVAALLRQFGSFEDTDEDAAALDTAIRAAMLLGAEQVIVDVSPSSALSFDLTNTRAIAYLEEHSLESLGEMLDLTTAATIKGILLEGLDARQGYTEIANTIRSAFDDMSATRAQRIAVTEMGNAFSEGTLEQALELQTAGRTVEKSWLTAGDNRVDDRCSENEGAEWIDVGDAFPSGDDRPLAHPNCRCALLTRVSQAVAA